MKIKTSELIGPALDWAVATCEGFKTHAAASIVIMGSYRPSTDWSQGGPLIDKNIGNLFKQNKLDPNEPDVWTAVHYHKTPEGTALYYMDGPTALIAAMRTIVFRFLGDEVDVPEELV